MDTELQMGLGIWLVLTEAKVSFSVTPFKDLFGEFWRLLPALFDFPFLLSLPRTLRIPPHLGLKTDRISMFKFPPKSGGNPAS